MILTHVEVIVRDTEIRVQPICAESYDRPAHIAHECQTLADEYKQPVVLLGRENDRHTFYPQKKSSK